MEISAEKTKLMTNSANGIQREIKVKGQKLGTVTSFKYLRAVVSDDLYNVCADRGLIHSSETSDHQKSQCSYILRYGST